MSIFSYFFSSDSEEDNEQAEETLEPQATPPENPLADTLVKGARMDVVTREGKALLSGRIADFADDILTLERLPGELSFKISPINASVNLNGYDKRMLPVSLSAVVQESTRISLKLKDLKLEQHAQNRESFRLPCSAPVSLYRQDDERMRNPEECKLINISTGGCCVQSEYIHMEDEVLRIHIQLDDYTPLNFMGQIVRCTENTPGQFWYGILFAQMEEKEIAALNKTLYDMQRGVKNIPKKTQNSRW